MTTPQLVNWAGALTDAGHALAKWIEASGTVIPDVPAAKRDSTPPIARFFDTYPDEAAVLWAQFSEVTVYE